MPTPASCSFFFYVSALIGDSPAEVPARLRSDDGSGTNWGTTLEATVGDFGSTATNIEDDLTWDSTGWKEMTVDPSNLNWSATAYFRVAGTDENDPSYKRATINSQNNSSNKPYLHCVAPTAGMTPTRCSTGAGL